MCVNVRETQPESTPEAGELNRVGSAHAGLAGFAMVAVFAILTILTDVPCVTAAISGGAMVKMQRRLRADTVRFIPEHE